MTDDQVQNAAAIAIDSLEEALHRNSNLFTSDRSAQRLAVQLEPHFKT
jgi:hypothetical protein